MGSTSDNSMHKCWSIFISHSNKHNKIIETGVEEAVLHWSGKSFYAVWTTLSVWKATARGLAIFRRLKVHRPYCVQSTISIQSILMLQSLRACLQNNFENEMLWDWIWGHFRIKLSNSMTMCMHWFISSHSYSYVPDGILASYLHNGCIS